MTPESHFSKEKLTPSRHLILDLDGVIMRWPSAHLPDAHSQAQFFECLARAKAEGIAISALTNRPPSHMQPFAYQLGVRDGIFVTESGGSYYDVSTHKTAVIPRWAEYATVHVPHLREKLIKQNLVTNIPIDVSLGAQFEPGMGFVKTVLIPPIGVSSEEYATTLGEYVDSNLFTIEPGKAVDIDPIGLSKAEGMQFLLERNGIDPKTTPTMFVADAYRDIAAAHTLLKQGGHVGVVGNADSRFSDAFYGNPNAHYAPRDTSYFSSVTAVLAEFIHI